MRQIAIVIVLVACSFVSQASAAPFAFGFSYGQPGYVAQTPVVEAPVLVAPPVYMAPPVYFAPPPVYYAPAPAFYYRSYGYGYGYRYAPRGYGYGGYGHRAYHR